MSQTQQLLEQVKQQIETENGVKIGIEIDGENKQVLFKTKKGFLKIPPVVISFAEIEQVFSL